MGGKFVAALALLTCAGSQFLSAPSRADDSGTQFFSVSDPLHDFYAGVGGQLSNMTAGELTNAGACSNVDPLSYFDCGESAVFSDELGGGFRLEVGTRIEAFRVFTLLQGNFWSDVSGPAIVPSGRGTATVTYDMRAITWTFGVGLDSAVLFPELLPPKWNIGIQGSIGPSWNKIGDLFAAGVVGVESVAFLAPGGTNTDLAGEIEIFGQYAFSDRAALRVGYASKWLGRFKSDGGLETQTIDGVPVAPEIVGPAQTDNRRVDEIFAQVDFNF